MSGRQIGIVDYGVGNLKSVSNALIEIGAIPTVSGNPDELARCDRLILPGVGAFGEGMKALKGAMLDAFLKDAVAGGTELLGICLGMQMLTESSTEFGDSLGLGILPGKIDRLARPGREQGFRLPNVGWLPLEIKADCAPIAASLFDGIDASARFYFIHSFAADEDNPVSAAISEYDGVRFSATIARGNVVGTQFHPEKSGPAGLRLLKNFVDR